MIAARIGVIAVALAMAPGWGPCLAQALSDPMQPPAFASPAAAGEQAWGGGLVLQSTLLSNGRRIAMIDGKPMKVGDRIGGARITSIDPGAVTLREANTTRVLKLYPGVELTHPGAAKAAASRKGAKEGAK
jgi:MSHA biogenesis protein MshK